MGNKMVQYRFKRYTDGKLCDTGDYSKEFLTKTSFEYPERGKKNFSLVKVRKINSYKTEGIQMNVINYTGKNIVTTDVYEKFIKTEIDRIYIS